jgi:hypothetical protein
MTGISDPRTGRGRKRRKSKGFNGASFVKYAVDNVLGGNYILYLIDCQTENLKFRIKNSRLQTNLKFQFSKSETF